MYTNNTIKKSLEQLNKAIENLEILSHEWSIPILRHLKSVSAATFSQLLHETNLTSDTLSNQLSALEEAGIIKNDDDNFELDQYKLLRIQLITKQLIDNPVSVYGEH